MSIYANVHIQKDYIGEREIKNARNVNVQSLKKKKALPENNI